MNNKAIIAIGAVLILVIAAQAFYTYNLSRQVEQLGGRSDVQALQQPPSSNAPAPSAKLPKLPKGDPFSDDWNPFEEMQRMQNEMNKIFGDMRSQLQVNPNFNDLNGGFTFAPNVDMQDQDDRYVITVDIPGADESNINVKLDGNQLHISATTRKSNKQQNGNNSGNMLRSERFFGQFKRTITLPEPVVPEKMKTDYKDGVLTIVVPKK
ncbi:MAG: Hsp20/alpha crystallin family protein [Gammaproteobacteria bacterium]